MVLFSDSCEFSQLCIATSVSVTFWGFNLSLSALKCSECSLRAWEGSADPASASLDHREALLEDGGSWWRSWILDRDCYEWSVSVLGPGATAPRSSWGLASDVIVTSRHTVGANLGTRHTNTASEYTNTGGWMFNRVAMTAKNTVTMSDGPRGSAGTFPSRLEARVCQNIADPAQSALRSVAALVRP